MRGSGLGFESKLLIALLLVSLLSTAVIGFLGYRSGSRALRQSVTNQLTAVRETTASSIESYFDNLSDQIDVVSFDPAVEQALVEFRAGFEALQSTSVSAEDSAAVTSYYDEVFVKGLAATLGGNPIASGYLPTTPAQRYLQAKYTSRSAEPDQRIMVDDAGDGSAWSAAHAKFQPYLRGITTKFGFDDTFLIDAASGNVVYSAYKGADLGTNLRSGPYSDTVFGKAFANVLATGDVGAIEITDFEPYRGSLGRPAAFLLSPIPSEGRIVGVMGFRLPVARVNQVMTSGEKWDTHGLGKTGETYLVGPDLTMRSQSRFLIEDPKAFAAASRSTGVPQETVDQMVRDNSTILLQPVRTTAGLKTLAGETGTATADDYRGQKSLVAYRPLDIKGLRWGIVAKMEEAEALKPATDFTRQLVASSAGIVVAVCLLGLFLARLFSRPIRRLTEGVRRVAAGDLGTEIPVTSRDDLGILTSAFNDMSTSMRVKADLIERQQQENDRILLSIMPEQAVERYRKGDETIAQDHDNATVLFADVGGFNNAARGMNAEDSLSLLNELVQSFDEAAERHGVEKTRTVGAGYLASCGVVVPRVDHARRAAELALEMCRIVARFEAQRGIQLSLRIGLDSGPVIAGLVGRTKFNFDLWGDAVNLAHQVQAAGEIDGIVVSDSARERLGDVYQCEPAGTIEAASGVQPIWRLVCKP